MRRDPLNRLDAKRRVFVDFAKSLSTLSSCRRAQVGCIITDLREVYAIGYNGPPARCSHDHCVDVPGGCGCVHAEANAIAKLSSKEPNLWLHCTTSPCVLCAGLIINRGNITTVTFSVRYRDQSGVLLLQEAGIHADLF